MDKKMSEHDGLVDDYHSPPPIRSYPIKSGKAMQWIKMQDKIPTLDTWVLCYMRSRFLENSILCLKFYMDRTCLKDMIYETPMFSNIDRSWRAEEISHWQPLPEPPNDNA